MRLVLSWSSETPCNYKTESKSSKFAQSPNDCSNISSEPLFHADIKLLTLTVYTKIISHVNNTVTFIAV